MKRLLSTFLMATACLLSESQDCKAQLASSGATSELIQKSHYIFLGRVEKLRASTLKILPVSPNTAAVRVVKVLRAPKTLNNFTGQTITLVAASPEGLKPGEQAVFFTNGQLYGESIAVGEVGRLPAGRDLGAVEEQIKAADKQAAEQALAARVNKAELVISGQVISTQILGNRERKPVSEHDPMWSQAVVRVEKALKGQVTETGMVTVLYPTSRDVMWAGAPRFREGVSGIFILQRNQQEIGPAPFRVPGLTALHRLDFQPNTQMEQIRRLAAHP